ncbi:ADP-ribosylglycohydrolase family protein [Nocardioides speluncae]|uniref:ADP-ribosylglycohydrolase family protein n=1 Tax=Nocardioides speluncae TaxID=2670337 RepID=UPI001F0CB7B8|nr:ADP-ribosylglycohydrolase family protein [Nocardioides speluncae]
MLLSSAVGDALGVPYEFAVPPLPGEEAVMTGGGLGNCAPGEWSDDTSMAVAIARVAATGVDLTSADALDEIARGFLAWYADGPADVGIQTRAVLAATSRAGGRPADAMMLEAAAYTAQHAHSAGNGALMRTAPVALAHLDDRDKCARAARLVARLTHADPLAGDSCVLWSEAIRLAVRGGEIDVLAGLDLLPDSRQSTWRDWLNDALGDHAGEVPGSRFVPNGFTVAALQAALAAVTHSAGLTSALHNAVRIGNDTDTVAAIAGGLLGARFGAGAVPAEWRQAVHGWPGLTGEDLVRLALSAVGS